MGEYDIFLDCEIVSEWYEDMYLAQQNISAKVTAIYNEIDNMSNGWKGSSYDAFKANALSVKDHFNSIAHLIDVYQCAILYQVNDELLCSCIDKIEAALDQLNG